MNKSISRLVAEMILNADLAYYGIFLSEITKEVKDVKGIDSACIMTDKISSTSQMVINPTFWDNMNDTERKYIVLHEAFHYIYCHYLLSQDMGWDRELVNISTDLFINSYLDHFNIELYSKHGEDVFLRPRNICLGECEPGKENELSGLVPSTFPELNLEELQSSKYYYEKLKEAKDEKEKSCERGEDSPNGEKGNGEGTSGCPSFDAFLEQGKEMHVGWDEITKDLTESEKEVLKRQLQNQLQRISKECGNVPSILEEVINQELQITPPVVSWKRIFKIFAANAISLDAKHNRNRPNRRFGSLFPAIKQKMKVSCIVGVDQSGSMSDDDIQECNSEVYNIWKAGGNVEMFPWDGDALEPEAYEGELVIGRHLSGGTTIDAAIKMIEKHKKKHTFGVIFTDGYIGTAKLRCSLPLLLIITKHGSVDFGNPNNYKIVQIS